MDFTQYIILFKIVIMFVSLIYQWKMNETD